MSPHSEITGNNWSPKEMFDFETKIRLQNSY
jgi:hypothetical protein